MKDTILWLKLPQRAKSDGHSLYNSITDIAQWIERTAQIQMGEQARLYFSLLVEVNSLDIPVQERLFFLEQLHPRIIKLVDKLSKKYSGSGLPLGEEKSRYVELVNAFWSEMSTGYKVIIDDLCDSGFFSSMVNQKQMSSAVYHVLYYLTNQVYYNFLLYTECSAEVWRDIHQLFQFASKRNLIRKTINSHLLKPLTIEEEYKKIVLFSLANPFHLSNNEMTQLWTQLNSLVSYTKISLKSTKVIKNQWPFLIKPYSDQPPFVNQTNNKSVTDRNELLADLNNDLIWGLDLKKLLRYLKKNKSTDNLSTYFRQRLIRVWSGNTFRNDKRKELIEPVVIAIGGSCISRFLSQINIESKIIKLDDGIEGELEATSPAQFIYQAFLIDESENGFRIKLNLDSEKTIFPKIGEVVAIKHQNDSIHIGYLRWIRENNSEIEFGIEHLSAMAEPVQLLLAENENNHSAQHDVLKNSDVSDTHSNLYNMGSTNIKVLDSFVFPGSKAEHYKAILFTHSFIEKTIKTGKNTIKLKHKTGTLNIRLTHKVNNILDYSLFLFEKSEDDSINDPLYRDKTAKFENMWKEI